MNVRLSIYFRCCWISIQPRVVDNDHPFLNQSGHLVEVLPVFDLIVKIWTKQTQELSNWERVLWQVVPISRLEWIYLKHTSSKYNWVLSKLHFTCFGCSTTPIRVNNTFFSNGTKPRDDTILSKRGSHVPACLVNWKDNRIIIMIKTKKAAH